MSARNGAATKGPAVDTPLKPKMSASQREMAALRKELAEVKEQSDETKKTLETLINELRVAAIKQVMQTPEGQEAIAQKLLAESNGQPPFTG